MAVAVPATERRRTRPVAEPLVVKTCDLQPVVESWMKRHDEKHPRVKLVSSVYGQSGLYHVSSLRWIVTETGLPERYITRIVQASTYVTYLSIADHVLTAIGHHDLLGTEIPIYGNPAWTKKRVISTLNRRGVDVTELFWHWDEPV